MLADMMPPPTKSNAATTDSAPGETAPPVSGSAEADALVEPSSSASAVAVELALSSAIGLALSSAIGVAVEPPLGRVSQAIPSSTPSSSSRPLGSLGSALYSAWASSWVAKSEQSNSSCASAAGAKTNVTAIHSAASSNNLFKVSPSIVIPCPESTCTVLSLTSSILGRSVYLSQGIFLGFENLRRQALRSADGQSLKAAQR